MSQLIKSEVHISASCAEGSPDERDDSGKPEAIVNTFNALGGPPNPWGRGHLQLYAACLIIYLCSTMNGMPP